MFVVSNATLEHMDSKTAVSLTHEQKRALELCLDRKNVNVVAKAGTGKTTFAMHAMKEWVRKAAGHAMLLLFNTQLRKQVKTMALSMLDGMDPTSIVVENFHGLCALLTYSTSKHLNDHVITQATDLLKQDIQSSEVEQHQEEIDEVDDEATRPSWNRKLLQGKSLIIIDEAQDITSLYLELVQAIVTWCSKTREVTLVVLGDPLQAIYPRTLADFVTKPLKYLPTAGTFTRVEFTLSQRLDPVMVEFMNNHLNPTRTQNILNYFGSSETEQAQIKDFWGEGFRHAKQPVAPEAERSACSVLWDSDTVYSNRVLCKLVNAYINLIYKPYPAASDHIVLTTNTSDGSPACHFVNEATAHRNQHWKIVNRHTRASEDNSADNVLATIPQLKGHERKAVMLLDFNTSSLAPSYGRSFLDAYRLMYVACTRARSKLLLVCTGDNGRFTLFPTCNPFLLAKHGQFMGLESWRVTSAISSLVSVPKQGLESKINIPRFISAASLSDYVNLCTRRLDNPPCFRHTELKGWLDSKEEKEGISVPKSMEAQGRVLSLLCPAVTRLLALELKNTTWRAMARVELERIMESEHNRALARGALKTRAFLSNLQKMHTETSKLASKHESEALEIDVLKLAAVQVCLQGGSITPWTQLENALTDAEQTDWLRQVLNSSKLVYLKLLSLLNSHGLKVAFNVPRQFTVKVAGQYSVVSASIPLEIDDEPLHVELLGLESEEITLEARWLALTNTLVRQYCLGKHEPKQWKAYLFHLPSRTLEIIQLDSCWQETSHELLPYLLLRKANVDIDSVEIQKLVSSDSFRLSKGKKRPREDTGER